MMTSATTNPQLGEGNAPFVQLRDVVVAFGGLLALGGIDLDVARGERLAILGPNGAGKTTLFNVIAGDLHPTSGTVVINGVDCTTAPSRRRPGLGVSRTYQKTRLFLGLTVEDNLQLAWIGKSGNHLSVSRRNVRGAGRDAARAAAAAVWLSDHLTTVVGALSHGQQRQLEVGMVVVTRPDLMMLDEPASGLSRGERERLTELLAQLSVDTHPLADRARHGRRPTHRRTSRGDVGRPRHRPRQPRRDPQRPVGERGLPRDRRQPCLISPSRKPRRARRRCWR